MAHSSLAVANKLIERAGPAGLSPMKLLKLTYLCQGWMLGLYGQPLTWSDVEAWRYGPVFREIYGPVAGKSIVNVPISPFMGRTQAAFDQIEENLIEQVHQKYGAFTGLQLSALTHEPGSPWDVTYKAHGQNAVIPKELIREYYAKQVK